MQEIFERQTALSSHIIMLCRYLRTKGFTMTCSEETDVMMALSVLPPVTKERFVETLRAVLCKNQYQFEIFSELYKEFLFEIEKANNSKIKKLPDQDHKAKKTKKPSLEVLKSWLYNNGVKAETEIASFSNIEVLAKKDFSEMDQEEIDFILRTLESLRKKILRRTSRIYKMSRKRHAIDMRATMRQNFRKGTDISEVIYSTPKEKKLKLVLLCDVSKSMDLYSRFFVQMIYAFQTSYDKIETFIFSTALHQVSSLLDNNEFNKAYELISDSVPQWSGGTKIGACFEDFNNRFSYRMLDRKTVVMILSDGWDTGDPTLMESSMKHIHKSARRVLWLNPLAGHAAFEPETVGMQAALPYISQLHSAHNLESLRRAIKSL
ncbi:MAG: hypothetical protein ACJA01_002343 [Saprospiraceae bacterium]|jgi:uncharacterized protein with von Willebrand factor type A (vWA) domain